MEEETPTKARSRTHALKTFEIKPVTDPQGMPPRIIAHYSMALAKQYADRKYGKDNYTIKGPF